MRADYTANLQTIPGRDIRQTVTTDAHRAAWKRSLARLEAAGLGWTKGAAELREKLEGTR